MPSMRMPRSRSATRPLAAVPAALLLALVVVACTRPADCLPETAWLHGRDGRPATPGCRGEDYLGAHRLGAALHALRDEHRALEAELAAAPESRQGPIRRRQRQLQVDIEAVQGLARINGWDPGAQ
jgi:hypothetical protein